MSSILVPYLLTALFLNTYSPSVNTAGTSSLTPLPPATGPPELYFFIIPPLALPPPNILLNIPPNNPPPPPLCSPNPPPPVSPPIRLLIPMLNCSFIIC